MFQLHFANFYVTQSVNHCTDIPRTRGLGCHFPCTSTLWYSNYNFWEYDIIMFVSKIEKEYGRFFSSTVQI